MLDLGLLRVIKYREQFQKIVNYVPHAAVSKQTVAVVKDFERYFDEHEDQTKVDLEVFQSLFFNVYHPGMKAEDREAYETLLSRLNEDAPESVAKTMINGLLELEFATNIGNALADYNLGEEVEILELVQTELEEVQAKLERTSRFAYAGFEDNTVEEEVQAGLRWPLRAMNDNLMPLLPGMQHIIAARPDQGKTSFLTHLNAEAAKDMAPGERVVWICNEGKRGRIMSRQIQSALNMTSAEMVAAKQAGKLNDLYLEAMGDLERVRVYDAHNWFTRDVENLLRTYKDGECRVLIFDMLDHVNSRWGAEREDQRLESLYKWSRSLAVRHNCTVLCTSQISNEGDGMLFPTQGMLKESKTGKQGACDAIIMIGSSNDPLSANIRGISLPKNKIRLPGGATVRDEVLFDHERGRFHG